MRTENHNTIPIIVVGDAVSSLRKPPEFRFSHDQSEEEEEDPESDDDESEEE